MKLRAALHVRGKTTCHTASQLRVLREYVRDMGWEISGEHVDLDPPVGKHPALDCLVSAIHKGTVEAVLATELHRFGLTISGSVQFIADLASRGTQLVLVQGGYSSFSEQGLASMELVAAIATAGREVARERGQASVARARRLGSRIGRPRVAIDIQRAAKLRAQGMSFRQVASTLGLGVATVHRALSEAKL